MIYADGAVPDVCTTELELVINLIQTLAEDQF